MTRQKKNRFRALFLLTVFSLNTVAGFACSLGVKMGYNDSHHSDAPVAVTKEHSHAAGHSHGAAHHHGTAPVSLSNNTTVKSSSEDCCTNGVTNFIKLDKSIVANHLLQSPHFLVAFVSHFLLPDKDECLSAVPDFSLRRSWRLPNDTDLRIVIQSFQI